MRRGRGGARYRRTKGAARTYTTSKKHKNQLDFIKSTLISKTRRGRDVLCVLFVLGSCCVCCRVRRYCVLLVGGALRPCHLLLSSSRLSPALPSLYVMWIMLKKNAHVMKSCIIKIRWALLIHLLIRYFATRIVHLLYENECLKEPCPRKQHEQDLDRAIRPFDDKTTQGWNPPQGHPRQHHDGEHVHDRSIIPRTLSIPIPNARHACLGLGGVPSGWYSKRIG